MSKLSSLKRISREDLQGAPDWVDPLLEATNEFQEQATARINRETRVLQSYKFVHGVEQEIKNPFDARLPEGIDTVRCQGLEVDSTGKTTGKLYDLSVASVRWRVVQTQPGQPQRLGVTVSYAPPLGAVSVSRNTAQLIPNTTGDFVSYGAMDYSEGSAIAWNGATRLTFSQAGRVRVTHENAWDDVAGGNYRAQLVLINRATTYYAYQYMAGTLYAILNSSDEVEIAAGDFVESYVLHDQGAAMSVCAFGDALRSRLHARYVAPPSNATGRVTLRFDRGD